MRQIPVWDSHSRPISATRPQLIMITNQVRTPYFDPATQTGCLLPIADLPLFDVELAAKSAPENSKPKETPLPSPNSASPLFNAELKDVKS